jgi:hypothetical protein
MAGDEVEFTPYSREKAAIGDVGGDEVDVAHLMGPPLQSPGNGNGAGTEVDGNDRRSGNLPSQIEGLGAVAAPGDKDAGRRRFGGCAPSKRVYPI